MSGISCIAANQFAAGSALRDSTPARARYSARLGKCARPCPRKNKKNTVADDPAANTRQIRAPAVNHMKLRKAQRN